VAAQRAELGEARRQLARVEQSVTAALQGALRAQANTLRGLDLHAALYGRLAARWWGPLGWIVALWGALVRASAWAARLGSHDRSTLAGGDAVAWLPSLDELHQALDTVYAERWPPVADALAAAGFVGLRERRRWLAETASAADRLQVAGARAVEEALDGSAAILAHPLLQALLNAPVLGLLGWTGYQAVAAFVTGAYLPASYFQNAGIALLTVWAGCFVLLQLLVSLTVRVGLRRRVARVLAGAASWRLGQEVSEQIAGLIEGR